MNFKGIAAGVCAAAVAMTLAGCAAPTASSAKADGEKACRQEFTDHYKNKSGLKVLKHLSAKASPTIKDAKNGEFAFHWQFVDGVRTAADGKDIWAWDCVSDTTQSGTKATYKSGTGNIFTNEYLNWLSGNRKPSATEEELTISQADAQAKGEEACRKDETNQGFTVGDISLIDDPTSDDNSWSFSFRVAVSNATENGGVQCDVDVYNRKTEIVND